MNRLEFQNVRRGCNLGANCKSEGLWQVCSLQRQVASFFHQTLSLTFKQKIILVDNYQPDSDARHPTSAWHLTPPFASRHRTLRNISRWHGLYFSSNGVDTKQDPQFMVPTFSTQTLEKVNKFHCTYILSPATSPRAPSFGGMRTWVEGLLMWTSHNAAEASNTSKTLIIDC